MHDERIKEWLSCKIFLEYDQPSFGGIPSAKPFQCLHYFNPQCVTNWKTWGLSIEHCSRPLNICFYCGSKMRISYNDLYDYEWNLDGKVTRFNSNKHSRIGFDSNVAAASSSVIVPNNFNPNHVRDSQDDLINVYKIKHEEHKENKRLFDQFTKLDKTPSNSSPSALVKVYPKRNRNQTNFFLTNHSSETNTRVTVNPHRNIDVVCVNDESLSVTSSNFNVNTTTTTIG